MLNLSNYNTKLEYSYCINKLLDKLSILNKSANIKIDLLEIEKTINYIQQLHLGQFRLSGDPYYYHPIEVASIITDHFFDTDTIVAALLHDVIEDTDTSFTQIEFLFGSKIAKIVDTVTKISSNYLLTKEEVFNKINAFNGFSGKNDLNKQAAAIKVIDRLHNMRTIKYINSIDKQKYISKETIQFYVPLAKYVNLYSIAQELSSLAIKVLNRHF